MINNDNHIPSAGLLARHTTRRGRVTALGLVAASLLSVAVVLPTSAAGKSAGARPAAASQVLNYGLSSEPAAFKTGVDEGSASREILSLTRRGLVQYNAAGVVAPALASSYSTSKNGLTYTFHLRSGLQFSDGTALTSANVKQTLTYLAAPANGASFQTSLADIASIGTPDATTVVLNLKKPETALLEVLADPLDAIVPASALSGAGNTIGDGPFEISQYQKGVAITLVPFKNFYDAGATKLSTIKMTFIANAQTRVNALISGQVQMIDYVPASDYKAVMHQSGLTLKDSPGLYGSIEINMKQKPLSVEKVRQALAYSVSLKAINQAYNLGYGTDNGGLPIPVNSPYFDKQAASYYSHNVAKAKKLLAQAGYPHGFSTTLLTNSQYFGFLQEAQVVKSELAQVGVKATIMTGDYATQIQKGNSGSYGLMISGPPGDLNDPSSLNAAFLGGPSFLRSPGTDQSLYSALLIKGSETPDGPARQAIYRKLEKIFLTNVPFITTGMGTAAFGYVNSLKGFTMYTGAMTYDSLYSLATAYLS